jgi:hypothetical protein
MRTYIEIAGEFSSHGDKFAFLEGLELDELTILYNGLNDKGSFYIKQTWMVIAKNIINDKIAKRRQDIINKIL